MPPLPPREPRPRPLLRGLWGAVLGNASACPRCGTLGLAGQLSCEACGASLLAAAGAAARAWDARAYTPPHLADKILTTRAALEGERKQVTVRFADVVDSMRLGRSQHKGPCSAASSAAARLLG